MNEPFDPYQDPTVLALVVRHYKEMIALNAEQAAEMVRQIAATAAARDQPPEPHYLTGNSMWVVGDCMFRSEEAAREHVERGRESMTKHLSFKELQAELAWHAQHAADVGEVSLETALNTAAAAVDWALSLAADILEKEET